LMVIEKRLLINIGGGCGKKSRKKEMFMLSWLDYPRLIS